MHYFKGVYGTPDTKFEIITKILNDNKVKSYEAVFVGDSINDFEGAKHAAVPFIGRVHKQYPNPFTKVRAMGIIDDISDLENLLKEQFQFV